MKPTVVATANEAVFAISAPDLDTPTRGSARLKVAKSMHAATQPTSTKRLSGRRRILSMSVSMPAPPASSSRRVGLGRSATSDQYGKSSPQTPVVEDPRLWGAGYALTAQQEESRIRGQPQVVL